MVNAVPRPFNIIPSLGQDPLDELLERPRPSLRTPSITPPLHAPAPDLPRISKRGRRKIAGIAPVFEEPFSFDNFRIINASRTGQLAPPHMSPSQIIVPRNKSFWHTLKSARLIDRLVHNWIVEEIWLVMNKLTLFGLVMGLMFLGIIFFLVGFMTAYQTYPPPEAGPKDATHPWVQAHQGPAGAVAGAATPTGPSFLGGSASAGREGLESRGESRLVGKIAKAVNLSPAVQKAIPGPLQPFVHHASNQVMIRTTGGALHATHQAEKKARRALGLSAHRASTESGALPAGYGASVRYAYPAQSVQGGPQMVAQPQAYPAQLPGQVPQVQMQAQPAYPAQATYVPPQQLPPGYTAQAKLAAPAPMAPAQTTAPAYVGGYIVGGGQANPQAVVAQLPPAAVYAPASQAPMYPGQAYGAQGYVPQGYAGQVAPQAVYTPQVVYAPQAYATAPRSPAPYQVMR